MPLMRLPSIFPVLLAVSAQADCFPLAGRFPDNRPARLGEYEWTLKHKIRLAKVYVERKDWSMVMGAPETYAPWARTPYLKIYSVPMLPDTYTTPEARRAALDSGALGRFKAQWTEFGRQLKKAHGSDTTFVRLGWEFNCPHCGWAWAPDSAKVGAWTNYWRQIVAAIREEAPEARMVWCLGRDINDGTVSDPNGVHDSAFYPGDSFVDVIGTDSFDFWPYAKDDSTWNARILGGPSGLSFWSAFARRHGKPLAFPEWGLVDARAEGRSHGGDNAFFIRKMFDFMADTANHVLFHVYTDHYHGKNPMKWGMREYRRTFSARHAACETEAARESRASAPKGQSQGPIRSKE